MKETKTTQTAIVPRRLSDAEVERALQVIEESRALLESMRARRGGQVMTESVELIREAREQRSKELLGE